ncbi:MAG: CoA transferase [Chloroflexi bacterium]|nr:CoA transferase [Chloroflexota bacterium]
MTTKISNETRATGALTDVRVVDFGHHIPGPLLGMLLADQGAEVIKIERPEGDPARSQPAFATWNRGKRSVVLDLKSEDGLQAAQQLAATADVVIENFRPGVADRLGIGYETLSQQNPQLVYCSLPGFGEGNPQRDRQGWEGIVAAATGVYSKIDGQTEPLYLPLPVASTFAAILGAVSVAMALGARDKTGKGQRIEVPLYDAMFSAMGHHLVKLHEQETMDLFMLPRMVMARQYQCADGRWVQNHGMYERFIGQFLRAAGRSEWLEELVSAYGKPLDPGYGQMWLERFQDVFKEKTAKEWEDAINAEGGACTICKTIDEWMVHEHAIAADMVVEVDDAKLGKMKQPGVQVKLRGTPGAIQGRAPTLGEHTAEVLAELKAADVRKPSAPASASASLTSVLDGIRVLDLAIVLAGPTCGRTLGEFGADVIKIDDPRRPYAAEGNMDVNRGKRSIRLDLKSEEGKDIFWRLVETADVVVENNRKGAMDRMGLGYQQVSQKKPDIIYASLNAFGYDGPWSQRPGWEQLAQATSGIQVRRGGRDGAPKVLPYPMSDYGTGLLGAYAVALALHERNRTGKGQSVDSGLTLTACLLQSPYFLDYQGYQRNEPEGLGARGDSALSRLYCANDASGNGWLFLHCPQEEDWRNLTNLREFYDLASDPRFATAQARADNDEELVRELSNIFGGKDRGEWVTLLNAGSVSATANLAIPDFRDDPYVRQAGLIVTRDHPGQGKADHLGTTARLSGTPMRLGRPTPMLGAETNEILREIGLSPTEIESLIASGVVSQT